MNKKYRVLHITTGIIITVYYSNKEAILSDLKKVCDDPNYYDNWKNYWGLPANLILEEFEILND